MLDRLASGGHSFGVSVRGRGISRVRLAFLIISTSVVLCVVGLPVSAESDVASAQVPSAVREEVKQRPDSAGARASAAELDHRVEDLSQRTETTQVFANPDGTWTAEQASGPVRVQDAGGAWEDIDTRLERVAGGFAPVSAGTGLVLSDGADQTFATMREGGKDLRWQWPATLPVPVIDGDTATYRDVVPDGDLVVRATATGFSHDIVLREAPEGPMSFPIPVLTGGPKLTEDAGGDLAISTGAGEKLVTAEQPVMYDSSTNEAGDPEHVAPVDATVTGNAGSAGGGVLTLRPSEGFLGDPDIEYPVTIDPTYTNTPSGDTFVQSSGFTSGQSANVELRAGSYDNGTTRTRSFLNFGTVPWQGASINSARLILFNFNSPTCQGGAVRVAQITSSWTAGSLTWAAQPTAAGPITNNSDANGFSGACPGDDMTWDVTSTVAGWASGTARYGFRIAGATETTTTEYRKFRSNEYTTASQRPRLSVTYNAAPVVTSVTPCEVCTLSQTATPSLSVQGTRPTFKANFSAAPNSWQLQVRLAAAPQTIVVNTAAQAYSANGIQAPAGALQRNTNYEYRLAGTEGTITTWSAWAKMHTAANTLPEVPGNVTLDPCAGACSSPLTAGNAQPSFLGDISIDLDNDVVTYHLQVRSPGGPTLVDATNSAAPVSGRWRIEVPANQLSPGGSYEYRVGAADAVGTKWSTWSTFNVDDAPPTAPGQVEVTPCYTSCASTIVEGTRPEFTAISNDPEGSPLTYKLQVRQVGQTTILADLSSRPTPSGGKASIRLAAGVLAPGTAYQYQMAASDGHSTTAWTPWTQFSTSGNSQIGTYVPWYHTYTEDTTWTKAGSPYVLTGPTFVAAGVTLTLEPGVVVKYTTDSLLTVTGTIDAVGTKAEPIVLTSFRDDTVMGDSNGDGATTLPSAGDYTRALNFINPSTQAVALARPQSVLKNVSVRYGGANPGAGGSACHANNADGVIMYEPQTRLLIEHSEILDTYYNGLMGENGLDRNVGSIQVRLSRFGTNVNGCSVAMPWGGEYFGNVFEGSNNLGGLWSGSPDVKASFTDNWFLGQQILYVEGPQVPREAWNFEGNAFLGTWSTIYPGTPQDLTGNWWGQPIPPPGSYFTTVLPAMTQPPKWRNPGLESDPAPAPITNVAQTYGSGSGEFGQVPYGEQADPVNSLNGSFHQTITDASVPALGVDLDVTRTYNSADTTIGSLGTGWSWGYDAHLAFPNSQTVSFKAPDGQGMDFIRTGSAFTPSAGVTATLTSNGTSYVLSPRGGGSYGFDAQGRMTFQKDVHNNTVSFTYDSNGHLASAANGPRSLTFAYTGDRLTLVTLPDATTIAYGYTGSTLTSVTDQAGKETQYGYTAGGRLETVTDPLDRIVMRLAYSATTGRVTDQWDGADTHTQFAWNPTTSTATMTDPRGNDWVDKYDGSALVQRADPEGRSWSYTRDEKYQLTRVKNPEGTVSLYDYNDAGDVTNYSGPNGPVSTKYNAEHRPVRTVNARGKVTEMTYSPQGDLLNTARPPSGGSTTSTLESFTYWPSGLRKTSTDADGKTTQYDYNTSGDLLTETSPGGNVTTTTYLGGPAGMGRVQSQTAPGKPTATTYTYDDLGRVLTVTDPLGRVTTTNTYDDAGRLATTKDAKQREVSYTYDGADHLVGATSPDPEALPTVSTYDANGNVATATDAVGKTLTYTYNKANEVTGLSGPQGNWVVSRTKLGQVASTTAPDQSVTSFDYNTANQVTAVDYPGGATPDVRYTYDDNGNRATMNDTASNDTVAYSYDALDQLLAVSRGTQTFAYSYTQTGRLKTQTYPTPTPTQVAYDYTPDGQLKTVTKGGTLEATYTYTPSGMPDTATIGTGAGAFVRNYDYDNADRLTDLEDTKTSTSAVVLDDHYAYDATDNPTAITHANSSQDTYTYDILDRLSGVCYNTTTCTGATDFITWDYDPVGRRTSETRPTGTSTYTYNPTTGQLASTLTNGTTTNYTYNTLGQLTNDGQATYTYNGAGRTATETRAGQTTTYGYDGDGKRLSATNPASTRNFTWDPISHTLLAELDGTGTLTAQYLQGLGPINRTNGSGTSSYYHLDIQGSVRALTNAAGATTESAAYEPFGVVKTSSGTPTQPLGFAGQYTDPGGLQHLRARQYNPQTGTFTAPDPVESFGADPNYSYAAANPMVSGDPTGLFSWGDAWGKVVKVAPIVATVASAAALVPVLAPIALPIAAGAGLVMAVDSMFKAGQTCLVGKGSCGQALLNGAASAALGFGGGRLAKSAYTAYRSAKLARAAKTESTLARTCLRSFSGATLVLMADGTKKPIDQIQVGDKVVATDPETSERVVRKVTHVWVHDDQLLDLVVDGEVVATTEDHLFWSVTDHRFERADHLAAGEVVVGDADRRLTVSGFRAGTERTALAYNLSIRGVHTYHVGQDAILVHNDCGPNLIYEASPKHGAVSRPGPRGEISRAPRGDCQAMLKCSTLVKPNLREGVEPETGLQVIFRRHREFDGTEWWHGYVPGG